MCGKVHVLGALLVDYSPGGIVMSSIELVALRTKCVYSDSLVRSRPAGHRIGLLSHVRYVHLLCRYLGCSHLQYSCVLRSTNATLHSRRSPRSDSVRCPLSVHE
jgi:hypothetical protein